MPKTRNNDKAKRQLLETAMFEIGNASRRLPLAMLRIKQALESGAPDRLLGPALESMSEIERLLDNAGDRLGELWREK